MQIASQIIYSKLLDEAIDLVKTPIDDWQSEETRHTIKSTIEPKGFGDVYGTHIVAWDLQTLNHDSSAKIILHVGNKSTTIDVGSVYSALPGPRGGRLAIPEKISSTMDIAEALNEHRHEIVRYMSTNFGRLSHNTISDVKTEALRMYNFMAPGPVYNQDSLLDDIPSNIRITYIESALQTFITGYDEEYGKTVFPTTRLKMTELGRMVMHTSPPIISAVEHLLYYLSYVVIKEETGFEDLTQEIVEYIIDASKRYDEEDAL
jgi:hypothetical protein